MHVLRYFSVLVYVVVLAWALLFIVRTSLKFACLVNQNQQISWSSRFINVLSWLETYKRKPFKIRLLNLIGQ